MSRRRAVLALAVFSLVASSIIGVVTPVRAQTGVDEANSHVDRAAEAVDSAFRVVDEAVAERDEVEARLFEVLDRYSVNSERLAELSGQLARIDDSLALTEARAVVTRDLFEVQAVAAYVQAVSTDGIVIFDSATVERAMVAGETLRRSSDETLSALDRYLVFTQELQSLRQQAASQREATEEVRSQLAEDSDALEQLFSAANQEVAAAYAEARLAEEQLARAVDDVRAAELAEAEQNEPERPAPTTTTPSATTTTATAPTAPTTTAPPTGSTTPATSTTAPSAEWPPIGIGSATLSWRPSLEQHFAADLVLDALVIIECESLGDPDAVNPYSGASGLFQFMPGTWAVASVQAGVGDRSVFEGEANVIAASWLAEYYRSRGHDPWRPWSCRRYLG